MRGEFASMTEIVDIHSAADRQDVMQKAVSHLAEGRLVVLPTAMGYVLVGSPVKSSTAEKMAELSEQHPGSLTFLSLRQPEELRDYTVTVGGAAERLIRRCWPGPVVVRLPAVADSGLFGKLPEATQTLLNTGNDAAFLCPSDPIHRYVSQLTESPLLAWQPGVFDNQVIRNAAELAERTGELPALGIESGPPRFEDGPTVVRFEGDTVEVVVEGVVSSNAVARLTSQMIVFVCTGNTCRSPMAEGIFRKILADRLETEEDRLEERGFVVLSAGLAASSGMAASPESVDAVREAGIDISGHLSRPLTDEMIEQADWIFTMTRQHREAIVASFPEFAGRIQLISRDGNDVVDPIGQSQYVYDECRDQIAGSLNQIADMILS